MTRYVALAAAALVGFAAGLWVALVLLFATAADPDPDGVYAPTHKRPR